MAVETETGAEVASTELVGVHHRHAQGGAVCARHRRAPCRRAL